MRKIIVCTTLLFVTASLFSQQTNPSQQLTRQDYLQKSKNQKKAAWIMLGGGTALTIGGAVWAVQDLFKTNPGDVLFFVGAASMVGSIPLFIASGRNKRKAMKISTYLEMQQNPVITNTGFTFRSSSAMSIKIDF